MQKAFIGALLRKWEGEGARVDKSLQTVVQAWHLGHKEICIKRIQTKENFV